MDAISTGRMPSRQDRTTPSAANRSMIKTFFSLYERIPVRYRITMGLVGLMSGSLLIASGLGFFPNEQEEILKGRSKLCESLAISGTAMVSTGQFSTLKATMDSLVNRDPDVLSISLRRASDGLIIQSRSKEGNVVAAELAGDVEQIEVPVFRNGDQWGVLEVRFRGTGGLLGLNHWAPAWLLVVMIPVCFVQFNFYLRKTLKQLNPTDRVPQHVQDAFDTLSVGLLLMDGNNRILFGNIEFADSIAEERNSLIGVDASTLQWEVVDSSADLPWVQVSKTEFPVSDYLVQMVVAGRRRTFTVNCSKVGRGAMATFDDITLLEEARKAAQRANESKSIFLANMSHEIRTPLNAVLGFTDVLRRGLITDTDETTEHLNLIYRSGKHFLELINDILDLSKIEAGKMEMESIDSDVAKIVLDTVDVLNVRARQRELMLNVEFETRLPRFIQSDPTRLKQIITNLIGNAIKFTTDGSVTVNMKVAEGNAPRLLIDVTDTGIGMTPEHRERIFESFGQADQSTTRKFGGTGLGLSISKHLTEKLGGTLTVTSELGVGSTFTVTLPIDPSQLDLMLDPSEIMRQRNESTAARPGKGAIRLPAKHVLIVDDGESNRRLIELILSRAGAIVSSAYNGRDALESLAEQDYALILMDMQMPVMDGYTAVRKIRSAGLKNPIVALTGNAMKGDREKCIDAGCDDFLTKPVDLDKLLCCVAQYIGRVADDDPDTEPAAADDEGCTTQPHAAHSLHPAAASSIQANSGSIPDEFVDQLEVQLDALEKVVQGVEDDPASSEAEVPVAQLPEAQVTEAQVTEAQVTEAQVTEAQVTEVEVPEIQMLNAQAPDAPTPEDGQANRSVSAAEPVEDPQPEAGTGQPNPVAAILNKIQDMQESIDVVPPNWPIDQQPSNESQQLPSDRSLDPIPGPEGLQERRPAAEGQGEQRPVVEFPAEASQGEADQMVGRHLAATRPEEQTTEECPTEQNLVEAGLEQCPTEEQTTEPSPPPQVPNQEGPEEPAAFEERPRPVEAAEPPPAAQGSPVHSTLPVDDPDFRDIVIDFVGRLDERLEQMQQMCDQQQFVELSQQGHWLKGSAGTVGYAPLAAAARQLEFAAKAEQADEASRCMQGIMAVRRRLVVPIAD
jgi:signal transduction histidine kinase/CheY-like chemotaxis protein/HPt (histidine-containing phosphotransfer) domain-containing protein